MKAKMEDVALAALPLALLLISPQVTVKIRAAGGEKIVGIDKLRAAVTVTNTGEKDLSNITVRAIGRIQTEEGVSELTIIDTTIDSLPAGQSVRIPSEGMAESGVIPEGVITGSWECYAYATWDSVIIDTRLPDAWTVREPIVSAEISISQVG